MTKKQISYSVLIGMTSFMTGTLIYAYVSDRTVEMPKPVQSENRAESQIETIPTKKEKKDEQIQKPESKMSLQPTSVYDMADIAKNTNPCNGETEELSQDKQDTIKNLYDDLVDEDYKNAAEYLNESGIFGYLSPICSAYHKSIVATPQKNGVALFTASGNGWPSIPNDTYSFGYLMLRENKILIYENLIENYFNNTIAVEYQNYLQYEPGTAEFNKASQIIDNLENKTKQEFETGSFENQALQNEYEQFLAQF